MRRAGAAIATLLAMSPLAAATAAAEGRRLHLACARGAAPVCRTLLANPRVAPGIRAAIEQQLAEIEAALAACEAGDCAICRQAAGRYPELPPPVLAAVLDRCGGR